MGGLVAAVLLRRERDDDRVTWRVTVGMALYALPLVAFTLIDSLGLGLATQAVRGLGAVLVVTIVLTALQRGVA